MVDCGLVFTPANFDLQLNPGSTTPIYQQIADALAERIQTGRMQAGERLPATRELAGQLGLNRTTISAAYALLDKAGLISGQVGRGSFVAGQQSREGEQEARESRSTIQFASSRPAADAFPLTSFRKLVREVIDSPEASDILQLGSPQGYGPLRRYLLETDRALGIAGEEGDVLVTNGCQQALDLIARAYTTAAAATEPVTVLVEDPVYHGLIKTFRRAGARLIPIPFGPGGLDIAAAEESMVRHRPRLLVVTPDFQNPTGCSLSLGDRQRLLRAAAENGVRVVENGIYSDLRYGGDPLPAMKQLDETGRTILLRSYSKVAFPGLRVGWVTAPQDVIRRLTEEKQICDLHSDQLAQAIFLRFAQAGELGRHIEQTRRTGRQRLESLLRACNENWPEGTKWTTPEGGMCLWVELPAPLTAEDLLRRAQREGVAFLPGENFSVHETHQRGLRISFGGLAPETIERGIRILGAAARAELGWRENRFLSEPAAALV